MKLETNPLKVLKDKRKDKVNSNFAILFAQNSHRHAAHARKREIAKGVLDGSVLAPEAFSEEAKMRGLTELDFAKEIMSKGSSLDQLELQRQKILARIEAATTLGELDQIGNENG